MCSKNTPNFGGYNQWNHYAVSKGRCDQISNCLSQYVVPDGIHRRDGLGRPTLHCASDMYFTLHNTVPNPYHTCWQLDDHRTAVGLGYGEPGCGV